MVTTTSPYHHRVWLLIFALVTICMVLFLFSPEHTMSMISIKNNLKNVDYMICTSLLIYVLHSALVFLKLRSLWHCTLNREHTHKAPTQMQVQMQCNTPGAVTGRVLLADPYWSANVEPLWSLMFNLRSNRLPRCSYSLALFDLL